MKQFTCTGVALVTPFNADFSIDFNGLKRLVREQIVGVSIEQIIGFDDNIAFNNFISTV